ncbi:AAA family ATPase [Streptomyces sp. NPDC090022]|uniref:AAA family ATPase n=1 Tax=Streptomyces sp. NPDC090022 TaxID=3365920 RepID=UPI003819CCEF
MSLTDTEWDLVTQWVRDHLFLTGAPRQTLVQLGFTPEFVGTIAFGETASSYALATVQAVREAGIPAQLMLLQGLTRQDTLASLPEGLVAGHIRTELEDAARLMASSRDPFLASVLKNGSEVFLDRAELRKRIQEFHEDPDKTVLLVDGEPDSGRSYTYTFLRHLGLHCSFHPVRVSLNQASTGEEIVRRLAGFLADSAGIPPLNPTQLNDPLPSIDDAVHDIVRRATAARERFWLVIDECDRADVNSDVWDCIGKLAQAIYDHTPVRRDAAPRLVLLGYSTSMRQLPYEIRKNEVRDTARQADTDDMRLFFEQFFAEPAAPEQPPPDPAGVTALVEAALPAVLEAARAPGPDSYMRKLCTAAENTVRVYRSLAPGQDFAALLRERLCATAAAPGPPPVSALRTAYRAAACLLTQFDPALLRLPGDVRPTGGAALELVDDCRAVSPESGTVWVLKPSVRDLALSSLSGPQEARLALLANLEQIPPGPGPERTALAYLSGTPPDLPRQNADELPHTLQAVLWLARVPGITHIPQVSDVQRLLERARLLQPLERLVRGSFQGRAEELDELRAYIGLPPHSLHGRLLRRREGIGHVIGADSEPVPPLLVHGPGGIGKSTLLAKCLLESLRDFPGGFPFAYIDFERPTLSVHEPATLIAEMARQLGVQYPERRAEFDALARECEQTAGTHRAEQGRVDELYELSTTRATVGRSTSTGVHSLAAAREYDLAHRLAALVVGVVGERTSAEQPPFVLVIDSFEEAQYSASPVLGRMWAVWSALAEGHPRLRTVVAGRALTPHPGRPVQPRTLELGDLDQEAAVALLVSCGVTDEGLARELAARVGGHPLSLKLAARAAAQEGPGAASLTELIVSLPGHRRHIFRKVDQMLIQGTLYERILSRIGQDDVRALVQGGLALRTITPELIREVLAEPCGLPVPTEEEAGRLFALLARLDLVEPDEHDAVRHRADLRAIMLRLADRARMDLMRAVGQRAVAYYAAQEGLEARAEEIYHRLRLNENPREVEERWLPGVERYLAGAGQDMAGRAAAYLGGRMGGHTPDEVLAAADQEDWERITAREVEDLLAQGFTETAAGRLAEGRPWTAGSPLYPLWVETLDRLGRRTEARAAAEEAVARADETGASELQLELLQLSARLAADDGDLRGADEDLMEAEEIATGLGKDFEALGVLLFRARLAGDRDAPGPEGRGGTGTGTGNADVGVQLAERLGRLPDEDLQRQPALVRAAAAQAARTSPRLLERALDVVGLPPAEEAVLDALAEAIGQAVARQPELRDSMRSLLANAAGPPDGEPSTGGTHTGMTGMLREARRRGTLDRLARRLLNLEDRSGELVTGVAAALGAEMTAGVAAGAAGPAAGPGPGAGPGPAGSAAPGTGTAGTGTAGPVTGAAGGGAAGPATEAGPGTEHHPGERNGHRAA